MLFQSTLPRRERRQYCGLLLPYCEVSIHAPTKGATRITRYLIYIKRVSIHAPTKGATWLIRCFVYPRDVSIHAPTKGATKIEYMLSGEYGVSIHAPTKGATALVQRDRTVQPFTIHAPTKVATPSEAADPHLHQSFNPRSHEGSDGLNSVMCLRRSSFQSTLPRRERPGGAGSRSGTETGFNPRSHEGSDRIMAYLLLVTRVSIHAPTKGATHSNMVLVI